MRAMWQTAAVGVVAVERCCRILKFFGAMMSLMIRLHVATPHENIHPHRPRCPRMNVRQGLRDSELPCQILAKYEGEHE